MLKNKGRSNNSTSILKGNNLSRHASTRQKTLVVFFGRNFAGRKMSGHPLLLGQKFVHFLSRTTLALLTLEFSLSKRCSISTRRAVVITVAMGKHRVWNAGEENQISFRPFSRTGNQSLHFIGISSSISPELVQRYALHLTRFRKGKRCCRAPQRGCSHHANPL